MKFFNYFSLSQAQQVHSMFPDIPLQAITLDLADTHSVSLTVDRVLNNTIFIPEQHQLQQHQQGEEPPSPDTLPPTASQVTSTPLLNHSGSVEGDSSDQEADAHSSESHSTSSTSSRGSSETPEQSPLSSRSNDSENTHSDSSATDEASETLRRRKHRQRLSHPNSHSSPAPVSYSSSSSDSRTGDTSVEDRVGLAPSISNGQTEVQLSARRGLEAGATTCMYTGAACLDQDGGSAVSFNTLQQRKEEMLTRARQ